MSIQLYREALAEVMGIERPKLQLTKQVKVENTLISWNKDASIGGYERLVGMVSENIGALWTETGTDLVMLQSKGEFQVMKKLDKRVKHAFQH